ncbi:hypothetical protein ACSFA0_25300 [Variovorax sp. LT1P1]|uniref:ADP-ribosyltransferase-containing protein n=1 Tax=Variovorax sp. LT1P1 TaxID=3443730 RepID=UPI003F46717D
MNKPVDTHAFEQWFARSAVVDESGMPLVVFHGTKAHFDTFRTPAWFTPDRQTAELFAMAPKDDGPDDGLTADSKIIEVHLSLQNPIRTDDWQVTESHASKRPWVNQQIKAGFDGVIFTSDEGEVEYIVFNSSQIRTVESTLALEAGAERPSHLAAKAREALRCIQRAETPLAGSVKVAPE